MFNNLSLGKLYTYHGLSDLKGGVVSCPLTPLTPPTTTIWELYTGSITGDMHLVDIHTTAKTCLDAAKLFEILSDGLGQATCVAISVM